MPTEHRADNLKDWAEIRIALEKKYKDDKKEYFHHQNYYREADGGVWGFITPTIEIDEEAKENQETQPFFGPRNFNILIWSYPYGFAKPDTDLEEEQQATIAWFPDKWLEHLKKYVACYTTWGFIETWIYLDFVTLYEAIKDNGGDGEEEDYLDRMEQLEGALEELIENGREADELGGEDPEKDYIPPLKDYGIKYKGRIEEKVEASYFFEAIDLFYATGKPSTEEET
jgi:hypothetical protein